MPQAQASRNYWSLERGFITEATELSFPPDATVDEDNFDISLTGKRVRRKGLANLATPAAWTAAGAATSWAHTTFRWDNPALLSTKALVVRQTGPYLFFYWDEDGASNITKAAFTINLLNYKVTGQADADVTTNQVDMAAGRGYLIVVGPYINQFRVSYDADEDELIVGAIILQERDFVGVDDSLAVNTRPTSLSDEHEYNLYNQGWNDTHIGQLQTDAGYYPSNADIWHFGKVENATAGNEDVFLTDQLLIQDFGSAAAPKGRIIINVFNTADITLGESSSLSISSYTYSATTQTITTTGSHGLTTGDILTLSGHWMTYLDQEDLQTFGSLDGVWTVTVTGATTFTIPAPIYDFEPSNPQPTTISAGSLSVAELEHPSPSEYSSRLNAVGFFAGRAWYAGLEDPALSANVYFSQIIDSELNFGRCYQSADPTSEHISDIVATDGGRITIPGAGRIVALRPVGGSMLVFSTQGVWEIGAAGDGSFFSATGFAVRKVSGVRVLSGKSVVDVDGLPMFWAAEGIYIIMQDSNTGYLTARSVTEETIQSFYNELPTEILPSVQGKYDDRAKRAVWLYKSDSSLTRFDKALILDVRRGSFIKYSFGYITNGPTIQSLFISRKSYNDTKLHFCVMDDEDAVLATLSDEDFLDWYAFDSTGVDAAGYLLTTYVMPDPLDRFGNPDAMRFKSSPYLYCYFNKTETGYEADGDELQFLNPSSCYMQVRWNWTDHTNSGKFSEEQQVYRHQRLWTPADVNDTFQNGEPVIVTRNKVRGRGRTLQVYFRTEAGYDCQLIGWSIFVNMNTRP